MTPTSDPPAGGATRRVAANTILQAAASVLGQLGMLVMYAVMAREAGTAAFGDFMSAASLALLVLVAAFGMDFRITRLVALGEEGVGEAFWGALILKLAAGLVLVLVTLAVAVAGPYEDRVVTVTGLLGIAMLVELAMISPHAVFRGLENLRTVALALVLHRGLLAVAGTTLILRGAPVETVAAAWIGSALVAFVYSLHALRRHGIRFPFQVTRSGLRYVGLDSFALGLAGVFGALLARLDIVILGFLTDSESVALYAGAYRMIESMQFITAAITLASFPVLARLTRTTLPSLSEGATLALKATVVVTVPIAVLFATFADPLLPLVFGEGFRGGTEVLRILAPVVVLSATCGLVGGVLAAQRRQRAILLSVAAATVVNVVLNLLLIPPLGIDGAAIAMISTVVVQAAIVVPAATRLAGGMAGRRVLVGPAAAGAAMAAVGVGLGADAVGMLASLAAFMLVLVVVERLAFPHDAQRVVAIARRRSRTAT